MTAMTAQPQNHELVTAQENTLIMALADSFYPGANINSVRMVLNYCRAAGLDPMTKPVHIVPMSVKKPGTRDYEWRDVVMPGIELYRIKADRSGRYVGQDDAEFGPKVEKWGITFPEWCKVTVYKLTEIGKVAYSAKVFWLESYATAGRDSDAPNSMWKKRPFGQIEKCAEAAALRKAFPEVGAQPTMEEMYGKTLGEGDAITPEALEHVNPAPSNSRTEEVRARLAGRNGQAKAHPVNESAPVVDLTKVLGLIRDAGTLDDLHGAGEMAKYLASDSDKAEARRVYKARQAAMKRDAEAAAKAQADAEARRREAEEEARLEREAIQAESDGETTAADFFAGEAA